jgi:hypothetical protein
VIDVILLSEFRRSHPRERLIEPIQSGTICDGSSIESKKIKNKEIIEMVSRFKVLTVCLGALMALSAVGAGVARAAQPLQPQFTREGKTISSQYTIRDSSQQTRMWASSLGTVIRCEKDESNGTIGPKGLGNGRIFYRECRVSTVKENATTNQSEEFEEMPGCEVGINGEIRTTQGQTHLVWEKGVNRIRALLTPFVGTVFTELSIKKIAGSELPCTTVTLKVEGSELGQVWRYRKGILSLPTEEATIGYLMFDTKNESSEVRQLDREWEVKQTEGEAVKTGTAELILSGAKTVAQESTNMGELAKQGLKTPLPLGGGHRIAR